MAKKDGKISGTNKAKPTGPHPALARATAELAAVPSDLTAWWRLCLALGGADEAKEATDATRRLGLCAARVGQVALAAACARTLAHEGSSEEARAVVDLIAALHSSESTAIDKTARRLPPARVPTGIPSSAAAPATAAETVLSAHRAIDSAEADAGGRVPRGYPPTPLITALEGADVAEFIAAMSLRSFSAGEDVVRAGAPASSLFWVARGSVEVSRDETVLGTIRSNSFFGEIALVGATVRTATVRTCEDTWLLELSAASIEQAAAKAPRLARVIAKYARARLLDAVMRTSELFSRLSEEERTAMLPRFSTRVFEEGSALIRSGEANDCLYVLASGAAEVRDGDRVIAEVGPGDGVGEMSLLSQNPAMADVIATEAVTVLALSKAEFDVLGLSHPGLLAEVYRLKVEREGQNRGDVIHDAEEFIV